SSQCTGGPVWARRPAPYPDRDRPGARGPPGNRRREGGDLRRQSWPRDRRRRHSGDRSQSRARGRARRDRGRRGGGAARPPSPIVSLMRAPSAATARFRLAIVTAGLVLAIVPTSAAARGEFIGINGGAPLDQRDLQKIATTGVRTDRFLLSWGAVESTEGTLN